MSGGGSSFCDDNQKYFSTDLVRVEPPEPEHQTPAVTLLGFEVFARPCESCRMDPSWPSPE